MSKKSGRLGKLYVSADGNNYSLVGGVHSLSVDSSHETEDATSFDSGGYTENDFGETTLALTCDFHYDPADAGQNILRAADRNKTKPSFRYRPEGDTVGTEQVVFVGKIDSLSKSNARNEKVQQSLSVTSSGTPTYSTVSA